jgi:acetyl esterase/lipase
LIIRLFFDKLGALEGIFFGGSVKNLIISAFGAVFLLASGCAAKEVAAVEEPVVKIYKTADGFNLNAYIFFPQDFKKGDKRPAMVFFHGGGWYQGKAENTFGVCRQWASLGIITIAAQYRLCDRQDITPLESISDAKSVIRWIRKNADELGIDGDKIVACGHSAGGHLAACSGILKILDEPTEDANISSAPNAMILYYACFDTTLDQWFSGLLKGRSSAKACSPVHNVRAGLAPSLVIHGTEDATCPFWTAKAFHKKMTDAGNRCELRALKGAEHRFLSDKKYREEADEAAKDFLVSLGYLSD